MPDSQTILFAIDILGTVSFAISGAMIGIEKRADLLGVILLACTTGVGGGALRDIFLGKLPPTVFNKPVNVMACIIASVVVFCFARALKEHYVENTQKVRMINNVFDAVGLGAFSASGARIAIESGLAGNWGAVVFMAMVTGAGGGLIRDVMINQVPMVLTKRIYAVAALMGGAIYYILHSHIDQAAASFITMAVVFAIRMLATKYHWNLPKAI